MNGRKQTYNVYVWVFSNEFLLQFGYNAVNENTASQIFYPIVFQINKIKVFWTHNYGSTNTNPSQSLGYRGSNSTTSYFELYNKGANQIGVMWLAIGI